MTRDPELHGYEHSQKAVLVYYALFELRIRILPLPDLWLCGRGGGYTGNRCLIVGHTQGIVTHPVVCGQCEAIVTWVMGHSILCGHRVPILQHTQLVNLVFNAGCQAFHVDRVRAGSVVCF